MSSHIPHGTAYRTCTAKSIEDKFTRGHKKTEYLLEIQMVLLTQNSNIQLNVNEIPYCLQTDTTKKLFKERVKIQGLMNCKYSMFVIYEKDISQSSKH